MRSRFARLLAEPSPSGVGGGEDKALAKAEGDSAAHGTQVRGDGPLGGSEPGGMPWAERHGFQVIREEPGNDREGAELKEEVSTWLTLTLITLTSNGIRPRTMEARGSPAISWRRGCGRTRRGSGKQ